MEGRIVLTLNEVAVVIPARNESRSIRSIVEACLRHTAHVWVIDDASTDDTSAQLQGLNIQLLHNELRLGKGGSLVRGFHAALAAGVQAVITLDGDGQHDPLDNPAFINAANRYPHHLVLGARLKQLHRAPFKRLAANRIADFWISWAAGQPVRDSQCGHRLYPAELLRAVTAHDSLDHSFVFESEILIDGARAGFPVVAVPIDSCYPAQARASHFNPAQDIWRITKMVAGKIVLRGLYLPGLVRSLVMRPKIA